ncbi:hypothetical protein DSO57_1038764 [Entomophthora muscae]|uniref:Uncharacterized protein n=1 Tax=Entomophthora muscae TaxID=34485 RepID=A0ACC2UK88_9FUNG|nr:hypothetical protein DSO57_1038764 [Entomophthora muscae]
MKVGLVSTSSSLWKAIANIYVRNEFRCSGVFYKGLVLTTPTHVLGHPSNVKVGINSLDTPDQSTSPRFDVTIISYYNYITSKDYKLVLLKPNATLPLPAAYDLDISPEVGFPEMIFMGWGYTSKNNEALLEHRPLPCTSPPHITPQLSSGEGWLCFNHPKASSIVEGSPVFSIKGNVRRIYAISYREPPSSYDSSTSSIVFLRIAHFNGWIEQNRKDQLKQSR